MARLLGVRYFLIIGSLSNRDIFRSMAFFWRRNKEDKFSTLVLGLDKSIEELQAQEAAVGARTRRPLHVDRENSPVDQYSA